MVLAVLERRCRVRLYDRDVYVSTVGGAKVADPSADLAAAMAIASAATGTSHRRSGVVAIGEVGLAGELRRVPGTDRRLAEAARLGFTEAVVPAETGQARDRMPTVQHGLRVHAAATLQQALDAVGLLPRPRVREPPPARTSGERRAPRMVPQVDGGGGDGGRGPAERSLRAPGTDGSRHPAAGRLRADPARPHRRSGGPGPQRGSPTPLHRRLRPRRPLQPHRAARAGQDGRRHRAGPRVRPDRQRRRPADARPAISTVETGTRHRTADRVARQTGLPVVSVSASMSTISLYHRQPPARLSSSPTPSCPGPTRRCRPWSATAPGCRR